MKVSELKKLLKQKGCYCTGNYTGHEKWYSPITGKQFPIPRHNSKEVPKGTLAAIFRDAGI